MVLLSLLLTLTEKFTVVCPHGMNVALGVVRGSRSCATVPRKNKLTFVMVSLWYPVKLLSMLMLYSPRGKLSFVTILQVPPLVAVQFLKNSPRVMLNTVVTSSVTGVPQSFSTLPSNGTVCPLVKLTVSLGRFIVLVNCPIRVKFIGTVMFSLTYVSAPSIIPPFQACCPRKKLVRSSHHAVAPPLPVLLNVLLM